MVDYSKYPPNWKTEIVPRILRRANHRCEDCGVMNGVIVKRNGNTFRHISRAEFDMVLSRVRCGKSNMAQSIKWHGFTKIVLTIAHLDHDPENWEVKDDRLRALCQLHHLKRDNARHVAKRKYGEAYFKHPQLPLQE